MRLRKASILPALALLSAGVLLSGCSKDAPEAVEEAVGPNTLTAQEQTDGWQLLFDGQTFEGWRGIGKDSVATAHWEIVDGAIHKKAQKNVPVQADGQPAAGGDLMTQASYRDFELAFEWKISPGGNSGLKYNVSESLSVAVPPPSAALGFEYQVLDDDQHEDANKGNGTNRRAAGLYDLIGPSADKPIRPVGEWNEGRIVWQGGHGEHWLNGQKVVEYDLDTPQFDSLYAASKYAAIKEMRMKRDGHIVLQDHNDDAWFRNIKIRSLNPQ